MSASATPLDRKGATTAEPSVVVPAPGDLIAGKYRVERMLGEGGMGVVVLAARLSDDAPVAVKVLRAEARRDRESVIRFEREARALMKMSGEHVARILDFGETESGARFIAMEYLDGNDLSRESKLRGPLPLAEAIDHIAQACEALADVHAAGVVHRDLKPANLFLVRGSKGERRIKLVDFGIAKMTGADSDGETTLTTTASFVGSPSYMSPEQMINPRRVDFRTDIWALGVTLYRLLTRTAPFAGDSVLEICGTIMSGHPPRRMRDARPDLPQKLDEVMLKCLAREPSDRFRNVAEMAEALAPFGTDDAVQSAERVRRRIHGIAALWEAAPQNVLLRRDVPAVGGDDAETIRVMTTTPGAVRARRARHVAGIGLLGVGLAIGMLSALRVFSSPETPADAGPKTASAAGERPPLSTGDQPVSPPGNGSNTMSAATDPPKISATSTASAAIAKPRPAPGPKRDTAPSPTTLPGGVFGGKPF